MPELKLTPMKRKEIYNWKDNKGEPLPSNPKKKVSAYTVAKMYRISHTMVYKIWKEGIDSVRERNTIDTEILMRMIPVFVDQELKVVLNPKMILRIEELIQEVSSQ